ncbi:MAG: glutamine--fructose-6-phosphate transaminase (isomerizing) [Candidatus Nanoarchaeia archaeon]|nr:glutamine--fructose-6-phosphate transaminase (isomerizing) [Candidatus Nanoarchaeia archaeon]MDD5239417.1 glutamine--fructose-6-phosphate transaminase (isomerizing) [Candidatus Nanoarchaeia archaeon]
MCGIIGYIGTQRAAPLIIDGLKNLEYRGYDSAGIAVLQTSELFVKKDTGKIAEVFSEKDLETIEGNIGIAHSRWATHGGVTKENSHPHLSNDGNTAVVHNGIIENYQELRKFLTENGFVFKSQTDTEVIPNLIQYFMQQGTSFMDSIKLAVKKLEGSYALAIINKNAKKLVAIRKESPLVIGVADHGYFVASDVPSFLDQTKKVVYLYENDMAVLNDKMEFFNIKDNLPVVRKIDNIEWNVEQAKKGNFEHFMLKEISEQADAIKLAISQDEKQIKEVADAIMHAKGIYFVACGTSYHACLSASYKFAKLANKHVNVALASEFPNYKDFIVPDSLVIALSQSGETADVLEAVKAAKEKGARVISLVNVVGSSLTRYSDETLMQNAGPEICVLATKSYTSQLAILTLLAYALAGKYEEGKNKLKELVNSIYYLTSTNTREHIKQLAERLRYVNHIYLIGRDLQYPTAMEAALKIKEVSYIHAEGFAGGELKHGTIALIEPGTPCIVFTSSENEKKILSNATELKARGAYIIGVGPNNNELFDFFIKVRESGEANSICQIIPIQILAYQLAILRGCDPDKPRNLAKSVTVK